MTTEPRTIEGLTSLDDFLEEEGVREAVTARAVKRVVALQLQEAMKSRGLTKQTPRPI